ncbi:MAG: alanine dehydrogenase [Flavobacteriales bacterium]|jgi:alanine dehydrogenase|nr:alanine dehydrogenase [Flavobacteriales bacterium]
MITSQDLLKSLSQSASLQTQEEMLEVGRKKGKLYIGIPNENSFQENRVALVPTSVAFLCSNGHRVVIEKGAGLACKFSDTAYSEAGAEIADGVQEVYKADIVLKIEPPTLKEVELMQHKQTLISALQLTVQPKDLIKKLMAKRITAIAWDYVKDQEGILPIVRCMGEIAGNTSILIAAEYLSNANNGMGQMLGGMSGVAPSEVVIIGAGTVGEFAARSAIGLGAQVKIFDNSTYRLRRMQNSIGRRMYTSTIQPEVLKQALETADVAIGAMRSVDGRTPCVVTEEMVEAMKDGSVIVDVSIDQGGCFDTSEVTSHKKPIYTKYGVIHYCVPNIASRVSRTASTALSNIFAPILIDTGEEGGIAKMIKKYPGVRAGVYIYNGTLTNQHMGESFGIPYKDLGLLMAAF